MNSNENSWEFRKSYSVPFVRSNSTHLKSGGQFLKTFKKSKVGYAKHKAETEDTKVLGRKKKKVFKKKVKSEGENLHQLH